jgi:hypothetical protein
MAHFSSKPCDKANAQCCCSGWITANSCDVSWEAINAINAQVRYGGEIQSTSLEGSIRPVNKEGVWQLWIQCETNGPMFLAAETEVEGSCEWEPGPDCCTRLINSGFIGLRVTLTATPSPWSYANRTIVFPFTTDPATCYGIDNETTKIITQSELLGGHRHNVN